MIKNKNEWISLQISDILKDKYYGIFKQLYANKFNSNDTKRNKNLSYIISIFYIGTSQKNLNQ